MKRIIRNMIILLAGMALLASCRVVEKIDDNIYIPNLGGQEIPEDEKNEIDKWLVEQFTDTYNIEVIYRWDAAQMHSDYDHKIIPVEYSKVKPAMEAIGKVWFEPYVEIKGDEFLLNYAPKTVMLIGSAEWDSNGKVLGQAEGGKKIYLLDINALDPQSASGIKTMMHVVEHEFAHILHQTIPYPEAFAEITTNYDASSWYNTKEADAYGMGFVSRYARYNDNEDFVETMSLIMVNGLDWFENTVIKGAQGSVDPATPTAGVVALRRKVFILENYLRDSWGIEFFDQGNKKGLVTLVQEAIAEVSQ